MEIRSFGACVVTLLAASCGGGRAKTLATEPTLLARPELPQGPDLVRTFEEDPWCELTLNAEEVVALLEKTYAGMDKMTARFHEDILNATAGWSHSFEGRVSLAKQGHSMGWEYYEWEKTEGSTHADRVLSRFVSSDGTHLRDFDADETVDLVLGNDVWSNAVTFFDRDSTLSTDFDIERDTTNTYGDENDYVLALTPKPGSMPFETLHLVVDACDVHVKESVLIDSAGTIDHFRFY